MKTPSPEWFTRPVFNHLTPNRIIEIASKEDGFRVSWRYRDQALYKVCRKLCKTGHLKMLYNCAGESRFVKKKEAKDE